MYILASGMWFSKLIRQFFYSIDKIVYNFIPAIYDLLISIARTSVLTQGDIASMADRIYKLLAVFMVFKVTFSLIMYVVNPDDFSDKNKGIGKLGTNIVISLALLILTPYVFRYAYQLQTIILEDNSLGTLIFGSESDENFLNTAGDNMAYITLSPFFTPNVSLIELYECTELVEKDSNGNVHFNESCSGIDSIDYEDLDDDSSMHSLIDDTFDATDLKNYVAGVEANSMPLMFRQDMATATTTKSSGTNEEQEFIMDYKWGFSTVVGVVIVLLLVTFCMDVALRSIKLAFLQLIAPIPIISYVDPKSGKDGMFKKWVDMSIKTFLSLFIRLLALYFAVYIIGKVADLKMVDIIDGSYVSNGFIAIFIIVGALMFAKNFTKILEGLGIKLDGDGKFFLNPFKKFEEQAAGGKRLTGAVGGMAAGLIGGHGVAGRFGSMFTGAARGFAANKGYKGGLDRQADVNRKLREARINGAGFFGSRAAVLSSRYGLDDADLEREATQLRKDKRAIELASRTVEEKNKPLEASKKAIQTKIAPQQSLISKKEKVKKSIDDMESFAVKQIESNKAGAVSEEYRNRKATHQYLTNNQGKTLDFDIDIDGKHYAKGTVITPELVAEADNSVAFYLNKKGKQEVMDSLLSHKYHDSSAQAMFDSKRSTYESDVDVYNREETESSQRINKFSTYSDIHAQGDAVEISVQQKRQGIRDDEIEIEKIDREIKENQVNQTVEVNGETISLEDAQSDISAREKKLKDKQEQRKLNRETAKNRRIGGS